jgi:hypothetical protein
VSGCPIASGDSSSFDLESTFIRYAFTGAHSRSSSLRQPDGEDHIRMMERPIGGAEALQMAPWVVSIQ